jgi:hypothetical protein
MKTGLEADKLGFLTTLQKRTRATREIDLLETNTLDDVGLSRNQFRRLTLTPASVMHRMLAMAQRHGVTAEVLETHGRIGRHLRSGAQIAASPASAGRIFLIRARQPKKPRSAAIIRNSSGSRVPPCTGIEGCAAVVSRRTV